MSNRLYYAEAGPAIASPGVFLHRHGAPEPQRIAFVPPTLEPDALLIQAIESEWLSSHEHPAPLTRSQVGSIAVLTPCQQRGVAAHA